MSKPRKKKRVFEANIKKLKEKLKHDHEEHYTYCFYCVKKYEMSLVSRDPKCMIRKKLKKHTNSNHPGMKMKEFNPVQAKKQKNNKKKKKKKENEDKKKTMKYISDDAALTFLQCKMVFVEMLECTEFDTLVSCLKMKDRKEMIKFWREYVNKEQQQNRENKLITTLESWETEKNVDGMAVIDKNKYSVSLEILNKNGDISKSACSRQWSYDRNSMNFWSYFANSRNSNTSFKVTLEMEKPTFFDIHCCQTIDLPHWYSMYKGNDGDYIQRPEWMIKSLPEILHSLLLPSLQSVSKILIAKGRYSMSNNTRRSEYQESFTNYYIIWTLSNSKQVRLLQINYHRASGEYDY